MISGRVETLEVAMPSVDPAVGEDADVEEILKALIWAIADGADTSDAGRKVRSVKAAEIIDLSSPGVGSSSVLVASEHVYTLVRWGARRRHGNVPLA